MPKFRYHCAKMALRFCCLVLLLLFFPEESPADYKIDIGHAQLSSELGDNLPKGNGVAVLHVEAVNDGHWMPDTAHPDFAGKTIADHSGDSGASVHATWAGRRFYGNAISVAPEIDTIGVYQAEHWIEEGYLWAGYSRYTPPSVSGARIGNHSWIGDTPDPGYTAHILRRLDWLIDSDEQLHFAGLHNNPSAAQPLFGSAFNVVTVGRTDGNHSRITAVVDSRYTAGRVRPDLVAPLNVTSATTPVGASVAALLIEAAHTDPSLSTDPAEAGKVNRNGDTIYNAERSEVIRALLMSGADRFTRNTESYEITDYRLNPAHRTSNGLDSRFGAGQLNVRNSYAILTGGEQNSLEDAPAGSGTVGPQGFDYDPAFGGNGGSNASASYFFTPSGHGCGFNATLAWNLKVDNSGPGLDFGGNTDLFDLTLTLFEYSDPQDPLLIAASDSGADNTETLWLALEEGKTYLIQVGRADGQSGFLWDYGLAWRTTVDGDMDDMPDCWELGHGLQPLDPRDAASDPDGDGLANADELAAGTSPQQADSDGDLMSDGWETAHLLDPLKDDARMDADHDTASNLAEFVFGTDPRDPESVPHHVAVPAASATGYLLCFSALTILAAMAGRTFNRR